MNFFLKHLTFADDTVHFRKSSNKLETLTELNRESLKVVKTNEKKAKVMFNNWVKIHSLKIHFRILERVMEYAYLAWFVTTRPGFEPEIKAMRLGWTIFNKHSTIFKGYLPLCITGKSSIRVYYL